MGWQFWVDKGGTFTDLVGVSPNGKYIVKKILSQPSNKDQDPIIKIIKEVLGININASIPKGIIKEVRIGTTVGTNALLEGTGTEVILFCNKGMKDLLKIGDQHRTDLFSLKIKRPNFIAKNIIEIPGRINAEGIEIESLIIDKKIKDLTCKYLGNKDRSCAIALLNSYKNPVHEIKLKEWLIDLGFKTIICSHEVAPLPRIVPRGQTSLVEATISPILFNYLQNIEESLGKSTTLRIMRSNGSLIAQEYLQAKDTILSGPAGGMIGAVSAARSEGFYNEPIVGFDMGGTSTDVFCIPENNNDYWERNPETEIAGYKLMSQRLPIHTVAAGGGSIVVEDNGRLKVGPRSAGAKPGPASYRRGGPLTITDANLLLGRIQSKNFPCVFGPFSNQSLDKSIVEKRFKELSNNLNSTPEKIAEGALAIAIERMADAIKKVSIFCGNDIRGGVLVAFGGAGGQHACRLANQLDLTKVLLHPYAGVLSAYGIGIASQTQFRTKNIRKQLNKDLIIELQDLRKSELEIANKLLKVNNKTPRNNYSKRTKSLAKLEIRYLSKEEGITVEFNKSSDMNSLRTAFESSFFKKFGYSPPHNELLIVERLDVEVEIINNIKAITNTLKVNSQLRDPILVKVYFQSFGWQNIPCYQRDYLQPKQSIKGPALIIESNSSIVIEPGWVASINHRGSILIELSTSIPNISSKLIKYKNDQPDSVLLELFHHRFCSIAEKMGERLKTTSRSVNMRERLDFSCAIFDQKGLLVANAPHIPVHLGSMGESIIDLLHQISLGERDSLQPYETIITNDPFHGGTHLPDITAITPVFAGTKAPLYFVASRGHHSDVGGITPGSMPPFSTTIEEEGLLLRNETFMMNGTYDHNYWEKRLKKGKLPPRNPSELIADLKAQVAANHLGVKEMEKLINKCGQEEVSMYMRHLQDKAELAVKNIINNLEDGAASVELDNGSKICVSIKIDKINQKIKLNFSNTSDQEANNFQAPLSITKSAVLYVFRCLVEDDIPLNAGCFKPIELIVPRGSILNPIPPAAVVAGNVETSQALCNLLFGALGVQAASQGTMNNLTFGDEKQQYYETIAGGSGAGKGFNGADGIQTHMTNSRLTDPEILEERFKVQLELFEIRHGSGGQGKWKGGNGLIRRLRFLKPMTVSILSGSRRIAPFGLVGGNSGSIGLNQIKQKNGKYKNIGGCASFNISKGESLIIKTPGGGGYGN